MKGLRITFLLPGTGHLPTGGGKVVYEYANHLSRRGHSVTLVHPGRVLRYARLRHVVRGTCAFLHRGLTHAFHPRKWFPLEPSIRLTWVPTLAPRYIPESDAVLATAWATADWAVDYPAAKGQKFYLIQSWETWSGPVDRVRATWLMPLNRIVVARWLRDVAVDLGVDCTYIPNGIDFAQFGLDTPIENRNPKQIMMLYHTHPIKGSADGLAALALIKQEMPDVQVTLFGTSIPKPPLPQWIDYRRLPSQPDLRACYNRTAIFIAPARMEGWPLPPAEAMTCGAALVATDIGGHREYGVDGETALLSPAGDPRKLADNVLRLLRDPELRIRIARQGCEQIRKYGWEQAVDSFEHLLKHSQAREFEVTPALRAAIDSSPMCD